MYIASFKITGVSSLLMNNPRAMGDNKDEGVSAAKKTYVPAEEAKKREYRNENGEFYIPTMAIRTSILKSCGRRAIGKMTAKQVVQAAVFTTSTEAILLDPKTEKPLTEYIISALRVVIKGQGIIRHRPEFPAWCCLVDFEIDETFIADPKVVLTLLNIAGKISGLLDFRPNKGGPHGRYSAELVSNVVKKKSD